MSQQVLVKYYYTCDSADAVFEWREESEGVPTKCKVDDAHTIVTNSIRVKDRRDPSITKIQEESEETQGNYGTESVQIDIPAGSVGDVHIEEVPAWDFDINVMSFSYKSEETHSGDYMNAFVAKDTDIGPLIADVSAGTITFSAVAATIAYMQKGYFLKLDDGTNTDDLGVITDVDTVNNTVTTKSATTNAFLAATPTKFLISRKMMHRIIGGPWNYSIGKDKIGSSFLQAGMVVTIEYTNNSTDAKTLIVDVNYLY
jgi:hypothetical protein